MVKKLYNRPLLTGQVPIAFETTYSSGSGSWDEDDWNEFWENFLKWLREHGLGGH